GDVLNDNYDELAGYSNYGFSPDENRYLVMPGGQLPRYCVPFPDNRTCRVGALALPCRLFSQILTLTRKDVGSGITRGISVGGSTSTATPHASALAALLLSRLPTLSATQLGEAMLGTGDLGIDLTEDIGEPGYDRLFGHGRGNAAWFTNFD
ncbi:MAG TPA: S8 family serine peptidase, partial [bacterium]|nr:S8 family serine peptidase [bacterium]